MTDVLAIMVYLCTEYAPELLGTTIEEKAQIDILYAQLKDIKAALTGPCYVGTDREVLKKTAKVKVQPIL